jgi:hypothetical protein
VFHSTRLHYVQSPVPFPIVFNIPYKKPRIYQR